MPRIVYCDGSCLRNGSPTALGGWNFLVVEGKSLKDQRIIYSESGHEPPNTEQPNTNVRMELLAVIKALSYFKEPEEIIIHSDSAYVVNGVNQGWYHRWFKYGLTSLGRVPANLDLWARLVDLISFHKEVKMVFTRGHSGHRFQEMSDILARQNASK